MTGAHLGILLLSLAGFAALALATERYSEHLLQRVPALAWRRVARVAGWLLLFAALALGIDVLGPSVGITLWTGWLSVAALALVFGLPKWPWQPPVRAAAARKAKGDDLGPPPARRVRRGLAVLGLAATAAVFVGGLARVEPGALQREQALRGSIGPWEFVLAEADGKPPELADMDVPLKSYRLRFCEACDLDIRQAYLKVNKPHSLRASGMAFGSSRWERGVTIQLPSTLTADSELWLTVIGKDGSVHQRHWRMDEVSPSTAAWFDDQRGL